VIRLVPHIHVTEREGAHDWPDGRVDDAKWEDCLFASAVEWVRALGRDIPATHAEAEALRADSGLGPLKGAFLSDLSRGLAKRYGLTMPYPLTGAPTLLRALEPGMAAVINGSMGAFPAGHRLRRWDPAFTGGHSVYLERTLDGSLLWCDPLAPAGAAVPERVTEDDIKTFMGTAWTGIVGRVAYVEDSKMTIAYKEELWDVAQGVPFFDGPNGRQVGTISKAATIRTFGAPLKPDKSTDWNWRVGLVQTQTVTGTPGPFLVWFQRSKLTNPRLYTPPQADCSDEVKRTRAAALEQARSAALTAVGEAIDALAKGG
jgi:hypothetical protein